MRSRPLQTSNTVLDFLQRHDGAAGLLPAAQRILALRADLLALMPATLRSTCEVSGFDDDTVTVKVSSASAAAKLRQTLPRLRDGLLERGWKVSAIQMRVQPRGAAAESTTWRAPADAAIPTSGVDAFVELNRRLEEPALKSAVERLIARRRGPKPGSAR